MTAYISPLKSRDHTNRNRHECQRKVRYGTADAALAAVAEMERTKVNPDVLRPFPCAVCSGWHIGAWFGRRSP